MGVAGHDLVSSYQEAHDWCAIWNAFVGGLDSFLMVAVASQHFNDIEATNFWGTQLHTFFVGLKVMIDLD